LGRECQSSELTRKRKKKNNTLEAKVDGILYLLQSVNGTPKAGAVNTLAFRSPGDVTLNGHQITATPGSQPEAYDRPKTLDHASLESSPSGTNSYSVVTPAPSNIALNASDYLRSPSYALIGPAIEEADIFLSNFRSQKLIHFPFLFLPLNITAQALQHERPCLFLAIMAVSSKSSSQRLALGREIKQISARELLINNEGSHDVLLGLLVFITWYIRLTHLPLDGANNGRGHDQFVNTQLMSRYMHVAISMVFDLRLNKAPLKEPFFLLDIGANEDEKEHAHPSTRTMEDRRAVLACFVLSSLFVIPFHSSQIRS
jgi:hypothetical protein